MVKTLQFSDMTSSSIFFNIVLFLLSSLVTVTSKEYQIWHERLYKMLLNAAICQGYRLQVSPVIKEKPTGPGEGGE